jgi:hypothetical protein
LFLRHFLPAEIQSEKNSEWISDMEGGPTRTLPQAESGDRIGMA